MKVINVQEAKTHLSRLIDDATEGKDIILGKHGKPLAKLTAYDPRKEPRKLGGFQGKLQISEDFDDEDPEITKVFYREAE